MTPNFRLFSAFLLMCAVLAAGAALGAAPTWTPVGVENAIVTLSAPARVQYGAGSAWVERDLPAGSFPCSNDFFGGDPIPHTAKSCQSSAPVTPPVTPPVLPPSSVVPPTCFPDVQLRPKLRTIGVDPAEFSGSQFLTLWTCKTPQGYRNYIYHWSPLQISQWLFAAAAGVFDEAAAKTWCEANCRQATAAQMVRMRALMAADMATAKVTASGTATSRPVYALAADGTRVTTAVASARVQVGQACDIGKRIGATSYYSVEGAPNVFSATAYPPLGNVYAQCTFVAPAGVN